MGELQTEHRPTRTKYVMYDYDVEHSVLTSVHALGLGCEVVLVSKASTICKILTLAGSPVEVPSVLVQIVTSATVKIQKAGIS